MKRGFQLIEMLFYIALLTLLLLVVVNSLILMVTSYRQIKSAEVIESSAVTAMDRMVVEIRNAQSVDATNSVFNSAAGVLILNTSGGTPAQIKFDGSTSTLAVYEDNVYSGPLLSADARLKSLTFRSISTTTSAALRIEMDIESGTSTNYKSKKFYDTAILRGSY